MKQIFMAILIALATALPNWSQAQTSYYAKYVDSILQNVNKSQVTSGVLYDRAYPYSLLHTFGNAYDTTSYTFAQQVYVELYQASYTPQRMSNPSLISEIIAVQNYQNKIPIQVLDYKYEFIKPTAVEDGFLVDNNGVYSNVPGNPNPFISHRIQLTTLMAEHINSPQATLYLFPHLISRNTGLNVVSVNVVGSGINATLTGPLDNVKVCFILYT